MGVMRFSCRAMAIVGGVVALAACGEGATRVVLVVDDAQSFDDGEIDQVHVEVRAPDGTMMMSDASLGPGQPRLPRSLVLEHKGGRLGPFRAFVTARNNGGSILPPVEAAFSFVSGATQKLFVVVHKDCAMTRCGAGQTCGANGCEPIDRDPLPEWDGRREALMASDAGVR